MLLNKFKGAPDPLTKEKKINKLEPTEKYLKKHKLEYYRNLFNNVAHGRSPIEHMNFQDPMKRQAYLNAIAVEINATMNEDLNGKIDHSFVKEFQCWLMGKSQYNLNKEKTPWGTRRLDSADIRAYIEQFVDLKYEYQKKLAKLKLIPPNSLLNAWLYFKFIVMGEEPEEGCEYLPEYQWLLDPSNFNKSPYNDTSFDVLNENGQKIGRKAELIRDQPYNAGIKGPDCNNTDEINLKMVTGEVSVLQPQRIVQETLEEAVGPEPEQLNQERERERAEPRETQEEKQRKREEKKREYKDMIESIMKNVDENRRKHEEKMYEFEKKKYERQEKHQQETSKHFSLLNKSIQNMSNNIIEQNKNFQNELTNKRVNVNIPESARQEIDRSIQHEQGAIRAVEQTQITTHLENFKKEISEAIKKIPIAAASSAAFVASSSQEQIKELVNGFSNAINLNHNNLKETFENLGKTLTETTNSLHESMKKISENVTEKFETATELNKNHKEEGIKLITELKDIFKELPIPVNNIVQESVNKIAQAAANPEAIEVLNNTIQAQNQAIHNLHKDNEALRLAIPTSVDNSEVVEHLKDLQKNTKDELVKIQEELSKFQETIDFKNREISVLNEKIERDRKQHEQNLTEVNQKISQTQNELKGQQEAYHILIQERRELPQTEIISPELQKKIEESQQLISALEKTVEEDKKEKEQIENLFKIQQKELETAKNQRQQFENYIQDIKNEYNNSLNSLTAQYAAIQKNEYLINETNRQLNEQIGSYQTNIQQLKNQENKINVEYEELQKKHEELKRAGEIRIGRIEEENKKKFRELSEKNIGLTTEITQLKTQLEKIEKDTSAQTKIEQLESQLNQYKNEYDKIQGETTMAETERFQIENQMTGLKDQIEELKLEKGEVIASAQQLSQEKERIQSRLIQAESEVQKGTTTIEQMKQEQLQIQKTNREEREKIGMELKEKIQELERIKIQDKKLSAMIAKLQEEKPKLENEYKEKEKRYMSEISILKRESEKEKNMYKEETEKYNTILQIESKKLQEIQSRLISSEYNIEQQKSEILKKQQEIAEISTSKQELEDTHRLQMQLQIEEIQNIKQKMETLEREKKEVEEKSKKTEERINIKKQRIDHHKRFIAREQIAYSELEKKVAELESKLAEYKNAPVSKDASKSLSKIVENVSSTNNIIENSEIEKENIATEEIIKESVEQQIQQIDNLDSIMQDEPESASVVQSALPHFSDIIVNEPQEIPDSLEHSEAEPENITIAKDNIVNNIQKNLDILEEYGKTKEFQQKKTLISQRKEKRREIIEEKKEKLKEKKEEIKQLKENKLDLARINNNINHEFNLDKQFITNSSLYKKNPTDQNVRNLLKDTFDKSYDIIGKIFKEDIQMRNLVRTLGTTQNIEENIKNGLNEFVEKKFSQIDKEKRPIERQKLINSIEQDFQNQIKNTLTRLKGTSEVRKALFDFSRKLKEGKTTNPVGPEIEHNINKLINQVDNDYVNLITKTPSKLKKIASGKYYFDEKPKPMKPGKYRDRYMEFLKTEEIPLEYGETAPSSATGEHQRKYSYITEHFWELLQDYRDQIKTSTTSTQILHDIKKKQQKYRKKPTYKLPKKEKSKNKFSIPISSQEHARSQIPV